MDDCLKIVMHLCIVILLLQFCVLKYEGILFSDFGMIVYIDRN